MGRVCDRLVEVDYGVEVPRAPNPGVNLRSVGFVGGIRVIELGAGKRRDRPADRLYAVHVGALNHLLVCADQPANQLCMLRRCGRLSSRQITDVVDSFQHDNVSTVYTPNLRQDWRFASNRNAIDGSDNNCISSDPNVCDTITSTPYGYFCDDLLGMWIVTYIWFTVDPANPGPVCGPIFKALIAKNGANLDGTPIIKTPDETNNQIEANGCGAEGNLETGSEPGGAIDGGAVWLVCPAIPDPRNGAIAKDAFLDQVHQPNGAPQNPQMTANFVSLQKFGIFPGNGDGGATASSE